MPPCLVEEDEQHIRNNEPSGDDRRLKVHSRAVAGPPPGRFEVSIDPPPQLSQEAVAGAELQHPGRLPLKRLTVLHDPSILFGPYRYPSSGAAAIVATKYGTFTYYCLAAPLKVSFPLAAKKTGVMRRSQTSDHAANSLRVSLRD